MNAYHHNLTKESQIRYKKVGRKYIQVNDPSAYDGLSEGFWLVQVRPGSTSIRTVVHPWDAELEAAVNLKKDKLIDIIREASAAKPRVVNLSDKAQKAWNAFINEFGTEFSTLQFPSFTDNAERIIRVLLK